jgi:predicted DNA-binding transcriptional regulator AlpA
MLNRASAAFFVARSALQTRRRNVSDRKRFHIDKRAETIIDMLLRNYKIIDTKNRDNAIYLDQLLSTKQLAVLFGVSEIWLEMLRSKKQGPEWIVLGPRCTRYKVGAVLAWLKARARKSREAA